MKCCNAEVTTPFCPQCGKAMRVLSPIEQLLAHCRKTLKDQKRWASRIETENSIRNRDRWQSWVDALEEAVKKSASL